MKAKKILVSLLLVTFLMLPSCKTDPDVEDIMEEDTDIEDTVVDIEEDPVEDLTDEEQEFIVTEELYQNTLHEVEQLIESLNQLISNEMFDQWLSYLSDSYIEKYSDQASLKAMSQSPILQDNGIVLTSLEDYFLNIVVPSRYEVTVSDIEFEGQNKIVVWTTYSGQRVKIYQLEKIENNWKISTW